MDRLNARISIASVILLLLPAANAAADCRSKAASKAASMYSNAANEFYKCSKAVASGQTCSKTLRDAKVQTKLSLTQSALLVPCAVPIAETFGFASDDALAVRVAGVATGEGRQVVDSIFGRDPTGILPDHQRKCAGLIAKQGKSAGKKYITTLMKCGAFCSPSDQAKANGAFDSATTRITKNSNCDAMTLSALLPGGLTAHINSLKAGAQRVVNSLSPGANPVVSA